jgi:hypothetical protein
MTEVRNLLERAKPELLKAIAQHKVDYPYYTDRVENALTRNNWVADLPYGTMVEIRSICFAANLKFDINDPWALFNEK